MQALIRAALAAIVTALIPAARTEAAPVRAAPSAPPRISAPAAAMPINADTSLLVISPHPDDEILCCAGVMQRVLRAGGRVSIVWLTSGDGSELDLLVVEKSIFLRPSKLRLLARQRMKEARTATGILGVAQDRLFFLGYPDRGISTLINDRYVTAYRSRFTAVSAVPYTEALWPGHAYTGQNLESDLETVLEHMRPTLVLAPSPRDSHPDHRAAGVIAMRLLARRNELSQLRYWLVHGGDLWPVPRSYAPELELTEPPAGHGLALVPFRLDPVEEDRKRQAVSAYRTQMEVMSSFLLSFVRTTELFSLNPMPSP